MHEKHPLVSSLESTMQKHLMNVEKVVFRADKTWDTVFYSSSVRDYVAVTRLFRLFRQRPGINIVRRFDAYDERVCCTIGGLRPLSQRIDNGIRLGDILCCLGEYDLIRIVDPNTGIAKYDVTGLKIQINEANRRLNARYMSGFSLSKIAMWLHRVVLILTR